MSVRGRLLILDYLISHYLELLRALVEHIELSATSLFLASLIALPLGYWLSRSQLVSDAVLGALSILYAIPSMALLALLVPVFGLGNTSAIVALVAYAQFILVRNVVLGFRSVDPSIVEVGKGMGLSPLQLFCRVEFPLALPMLIGGLRIATISVIAIASLAAWINAGGLGNLLFEGIYQNHLPKIFWGSLLVSGLGLSMELLLLDLEKHALQEAKIG
jgi:osmoprotectant transport system permease protein